MSFLDSVILGIVEGLTEFLPVSSTGHLILTSHLLGIPQTPFLATFEIAIQLGAILAVVALYWKSFLNFKVLKRVLIAFIPTGIIGFLLYKVVKGFLADPMLVVWALGLGGIAIIAIEYVVGKRDSGDGDPGSLSLKQSFVVGLAQSLAIVPGVSRSGATIMAGLLMGVPRAAILSFSFLLAVPTMLAATAYDVYKNPDVLSGDQFPLLATGFLVAFVVAFGVIKLALAYVRKASFVPFGIYRIIAALAFWFLVLA